MSEGEAFARLVRDSGSDRRPGRGTPDAMEVVAAKNRAFAEHWPVAVTEIAS